MAMERGFGAVAGAKKALEQQRKAFDGMRVRDFRLVKDGDEAEVWFNGPRDEPVSVHFHTVKIGNQFRYEVCATPFGSDCVYCHAKNAGDKRVGKSTKMFLMNVADTRWVHKEKDVERSNDEGRDVFNWGDCTDDPSCKLCKRKVPRERAGQKRLRMSLTMAAALDSFMQSIAKKCSNCGGKISVTSYKKGKHEVPDLEDIEDRTGWEPQHECSKCDEPKPRTIYDGPVTIRRSGSKMQTQYNFTMDGEDSPPEYMDDWEPIDFEAVTSPRPADNAASQLEIPNPFGGGGGGKGKRGASSYDDEELPKKGVKGKSKGKSDDDDDDDDGEDPFADD